MRLRRTATALAVSAALLGAGSLPAAAQAGQNARAQAARSHQAAPVAAAPHRAAAPVAAGTVTTPDGRTYLADRHGRALQLHGLNLGKTDTVTEAGIAELATSGFNLVRLNIQWQKVEPRRGHYDTAYLRYLGRVMDWADRYGVLVLVDWHQDVFGPAFGFNGIPAWATRTDGIPYEPLPGDDWFANYFQPAVGAAFRHLYDDADLRAAQAAAYTKVAATLRGHRSLLGYDLFNEPFGPFTGDPTDPATQIENSAAMERGRLAGLYRRLIAAVRTADQDAWLFVEPTVLIGQGVPTQLPGFNDPRHGSDRIGYAPHYYDTAVENGADWDPADGFIEAYEAVIRAYPAAHRMPVLVGEWGPAKATGSGNAELIRRQTASMRGFATGWALWYDCHAAEGGGYCAYDADGRPAPGKEPVFAAYAPAIAGTPGAEFYDPATHTYTLALTTTAVSRRAWTELRLPATAFPHGARVSVTGARGALVHQVAGEARILLPATPPGRHVTLTVTAR
ncbi:glycoside hydrolase family 5 protein [Streptomyces sp. So13.3]|uniref:cellulase family glycosylhydrolase n=1 Tax=Streptomyces sp. So13.3 TaxID=2136173 RepID=UPI0011062CFC|nr:cellulase family glycosylhydrolase [Streptomyces sp. So13.3]QNA73500.1 glycoside hydrolase family 5 protein [Streptomyces sp. So13.3]